MFANANLNHSQLFTWVLNTQEPDYTPGDYYAYSNFGYSVLGRIIEKRTNQPYETWVLNNILKPAGAGGMFISKNSRAQKRPNEMVYYGGKPYGSSIYRMDSHGGWAGSASGPITICFKSTIKLYNPILGVHTDAFFIFSSSFLF